MYSTQAVLHPFWKTEWTEWWQQPTEIDSNHNYMFCRILVWWPHAMSENSILSNIYDKFSLFIERSATCECEAYAYVIACVRERANGMENTKIDLSDRRSSVMINTNNTVYCVRPRTPSILSTIECCGASSSTHGNNGDYYCAEYADLFTISLIII